MKTQNEGIILILILLLIVNSIFLFSLIELEDRNGEKEVCIRGVCYNSEIVMGKEELSEGLMYREKLGDKEGMLFVFPESGNHSFWMKNTLISLDIIWLNEDKEIVYFSKDTPPCEIEDCPTYTPDVEAKYVLEINSGEIDKHNFGIGYKTNFTLENQSDLVSF